MFPLSPALASAPFAHYAAAAAVAAATWSPRAASLLAVLLLSDLLNPALKTVAARALPGRVTDRPSGRGSAAGPAVSCDVFARCGRESPYAGRGFPSGHAQSSGVVAAYVTRSLLRQGLPPARGWAVAAAVWACAAAVAAQRLRSGCHTGPQVVAGGATGFCLGWLGNAAAERAFGAAR